VFYKRFDGNIVMAVDGSEVGIRADALGIKSRNLRLSQDCDTRGIGIQTRVGRTSGVDERQTAIAKIQRQPRRIGAPWVRNNVSRNGAPRNLARLSG